MVKTIHSPFTVLIDTKETTPWDFGNIPGPGGNTEIIVPVLYQGLGNGMGDYTIAGLTSSDTTWQMSIERKSIGDLFGTILARRERFVVELENLNDMAYAAVIVEAPLEKVITHYPQYWTDMEMTPDQQLSKQKQVIGSIRSWSMRYPRVDWWFISREFCPIWAYRLMDKFWTDYSYGVR